MAWSRVKNLLIALLVAVNVFLLVMYGFIGWRENRDREQVKEDLLFAAASLDIDLPPELIETEVETLYPMQVSADPDEDRTIAETVLGACEETVREDGSVVYENERGSLCFFSDCTVDLELVLSERVESEREAKKIAQTLIGSMGLIGGTPVVEETAGDVGYRFTVPLLVSGMPVFDSNLTFVFEPGFVSVHGQRVLHHPRQLRLGEVQELPGVLLSLFGYWEERGLLVQTVTRVELGYLMENHSGDSLNLLPVWHVGVQTGDWYVSALDGSILAP